MWSKKMEKEGIEHHDTEEIHNLQKKKMEDNRVCSYYNKDPGTACRLFMRELV